MRRSRNAKSRVDAVEIAINAVAVAGDDRRGMRIELLAGTLLIRFEPLFVALASCIRIAKRDDFARMPSLLRP